MTIYESVLDSLDGWGTHPVAMEIEPGRDDRLFNADDFRKGMETLADDFRKMGIDTGFRVPLFLENSVDFSLAFLALIRIGAVPVMVKLDYRRRELDEVFSNLDPEVVISEKYHLEILKPRLAGRTVITRDSGVFSIGQVGESRNAVPAPGLPEDTATINYTYRGYGYPLGSMTPHSAYSVGARAFLECLQADDSERMLVTLPMSHIFTLIGCLMAPLYRGLTAVVARTMNPRHLFGAIERLDIAHMLSIPEFYALLGRVYRGGENLSSLKVFISGGSHLSPELHASLTEQFSVDMIHGYGLTEYTPACSNSRGESRGGTIGTACANMKLHIADDGELLLDSPNLTRGYYRRESETAEAFRDGCFLTGDLAELQDGHIVFTGEKKNTRKINGSMIDLREVENAIADFPDIDRFRVDFRDGRLRAAVSFRKDAETGRERLRDHLIESIARYKVPALVTGEEI